MAQYERSIKVAFDKISGEKLEAEQVFDTAKNAFDVRRQFHRNEVELYCCECEQKLNVSTSKYDRLHFKHQPSHFPCILTEDNLSLSEAQKINQIHLAKETPRHKELKNKIANKLTTVEGVDYSTIGIDNKFIIHGDEKRRPDVYCKYKDKEIVFEIQLSDLSLRYILSRHEFYKKRKIYLIWILDKFDVHDQTQLARDIKYLTEYENFFKLDETVEEFKLECRFKYPFLTSSNELQTKWAKKSVSLHELTFDQNIFQAFYYNLSEAREKKEKEQQIIAENIKIRKEEERIKTSQSKVGYVIERIREYRIRKIQYYSSIEDLITDFNDWEIQLFNSKLNVVRNQHPNKPAVNFWLNTATREDWTFLMFILRQDRIEFDVNNQDSNGITALQECYQNKNLLSPHTIMVELFKRGYNFGEDDRECLQILAKENTYLESTVLNYSLCTRLQNRDLVESFFRHISLVNIIESAKQNSFVGFSYKPDQWASFGINAIQNYSKYWQYIEVAFNLYGVWKKIIQADTKGTFNKKVGEFYDSVSGCNYEADAVIRDLYPEIFEYL